MHARKNAYFLLPLYTIGLKIVPRDTGDNQGGFLNSFHVREIINKKYLLKRYLPIVPDPFFRIRILYTHFSHIIKATLSSFMHFFEINPVLPQ